MSDLTPEEVAAVHARIDKECGDGCPSEDEIQKDIAALNGDVVKKLNPYHDKMGRFTSKDKAGSGGGEKPKGSGGTADGGGKGGSGGGLEGYSSSAKLKGDTIVTDNVEDAVKALHENRKVQLDQPKKVSTLLEKLNAIAKEAIAAGQKAKTYNLCNVSVPGTNLFCAESKGIPRVEMPQLKGEPTAGSPADKLPRDSRGEVDLSAGFRAHLEKLGFKITDEVEKAAFMKASQNELNGAKVAGIAQAIRDGKLADERLFISRDSYIVDGHHRWAAMVGVDTDDGKLGDKTLPVARVDIDIIDMLAIANTYAAEQGIPQSSVGDQKVKKGCCCESKVQKANPYHDKLGRFTSKDKAGGAGNAMDGKMRELNRELRRQSNYDPLATALGKLPSDRSFASMDHVKTKLSDEDRLAVYRVLSGAGPDIDAWTPAFARLAGKAKRAGVIGDDAKTLAFLEKEGMLGPKSDKLRAPGDKYYPPEHVMPKGKLPLAARRALTEGALRAVNSELYRRGFGDQEVRMDVPPMRDYETWHSRSEMTTDKGKAQTQLKELESKLYDMGFRQQQVRNLGNIDKRVETGWVRGEAAVFPSILDNVPAYEGSEVGYAVHVGTQGIRPPIKKRKSEESTVDKISKANPYHDKMGRFTSKDKSSGGSGGISVGHVLPKVPDNVPKASDAESTYKGRNPKAAKQLDKVWEHLGTVANWGHFRTNIRNLDKAIESMDDADPGKAYARHLSGWAWSRYGAGDEDRFDSYVSDYTQGLSYVLEGKDPRTERSQKTEIVGIESATAHAGRMKGIRFK